MSKSLTLEEFIQKARKIHGWKYDYSKVIYVNANTKVIIICPVHGEFEQTPGSHLYGYSCSKCRYSLLKNLLISDTEQFIKKAIDKYGNKFDYSKVIYINARTKVCIICKEHGEFWQLPSKHLNSNGCPKCYFDKVGNFFRSNLEEFIEKANKVHNYKFDYSEAMYKGSFHKVFITCPVHGKFEQTPNAHLNGQGCPRCKKSKGELIITEILKKNNIVFEDEYKLPEIVSNYKYDFYLPDYRILIEFHGKQHYKFIPHFHNYDEDNFLKQKTRDILKKDHAQRFKYRLLEFNYIQLNELTQEQFEQLVISKIR